MCACAHYSFNANENHHHEFTSNKDIKWRRFISIDQNWHWMHTSYTLCWHFGLSVPSCESNLKLVCFWMGKSTTFFFTNNKLKYLNQFDFVYYWHRLPDDFWNFEGTSSPLLSLSFDSFAIIFHKQYFFFSFYKQFESSESQSNKIYPKCVGN